MSEYNEPKSVRLRKAVHYSIARRGRKITNGQKFALDNACEDGVLVVTHRNDVKTSKTWLEACQHSGFPFIVARPSDSPYGAEAWKVQVDTSHCVTPGKPDRFEQEVEGPVHSVGPFLYWVTTERKLYDFSEWRSR